MRSCLTTGSQMCFMQRNDSDEALRDLMTRSRNMSREGERIIYGPAAEAYKIASQYDLSQYTPAVILMTDGQSMNNQYEFEDAVSGYGADIPVFSITFGDADPSSLRNWRR